MMGKRDVEKRRGNKEQEKKSQVSLYVRSEYQRREKKKERKKNKAAQEAKGNKNRRKTRLRSHKREKRKSTVNSMLATHFACNSLLCDAPFPIMRLDNDISDKRDDRKKIVNDDDVGDEDYDIRIRPKEHNIWG